MRISSVIADIIQIVNRSHSDLQNLAADDHGQYALRTIMTADGDIIFRAAGAWTRLAKTATGKVLISGDAPSWGLPADLAIPSQSQGDILYFNGTNWVRLTPGISGYILVTKGAGADPVWDNKIEGKTAVVENKSYILSLTTGAVITQNAGTANVSVASDTKIRLAIRKDYTAAPIGLKSLGFYIKKVNNPTGNITFRVRKVSDDSILGEKLLGAAADITGSYVLYTVTFTPSVKLDTEVYLSLEFPGGDATNYLFVQFSETDIYANEVAWKYLTSWVSCSPWDVNSVVTEADKIVLIS